MLAAVVASQPACRSSAGEPGIERRAPTGASHDPSASSASPGAPANDWAGLDVATVHRMREDERGGMAVVLLHGWGARGDDLVSLAQALARPKTRFFLPAGPLPESGGGRAWWHLDAVDRPRRASDDPLPAEPNRHLIAVRAAVQTVLRTIRSRYAPEVLVLGGFSQGAMLSLDVALAADPPVDRVIAMSGLLLADSLAGLEAERSSRPAIFVSHGRADPVLPFSEGERAKNLLAKRGFDVTFRPFDGGHQIPAPIVEAVSSFLFGGA